MKTLKGLEELKYMALYTVFMYDHTGNSTYRFTLNHLIAKILDDLHSDKELMSKSFSLTKMQFQELRHQHNLKRAKQQKQSKEEKHLRKGLTKEECERRKYEAMKKKGLI